jgi:Tol biopolymer transport system component
MTTWKWLKRINIWQLGIGMVIGACGVILVNVILRDQLAGKILYVKYGGSGGYVYSVSGDGTYTEILASTYTNSAYTPTWSPDGEHIAFGCANTRAWANLCIIDKEGDKLDVEPLTRLIDMEKIPPGMCAEFDGGEGIWVDSVSWAPDGKRLAFTCPSKAGDSVCIIDLNGNANCWNISLALMEDVSYSTVTWSPKDEVLALSFDKKLTSHIYLVDTNGENAVYLTEGAGPGWSPDGKRLAFFRRDKLYLINRDGSGLQCIYEHALKLKEDDSNYLEWMNSFKLYFSSS